MVDLMLRINNNILLYILLLFRSKKLEKIFHSLVFYVLNIKKLLWLYNSNPKNYIIKKANHSQILILDICCYVSCPVKHWFLKQWNQWIIKTILKRAWLGKKNCYLNHFIQINSTILTFSGNQNDLQKSTHHWVRLNNFVYVWWYKILSRLIVNFF